MQPRVKEDNWLVLLIQTQVVCQPSYSVSIHIGCIYLSKTFTKVTLDKLLSESSVSTVHIDLLVFNFLDFSFLFRFWLLCFVCLFSLLSKDYAEVNTLVDKSSFNERKSLIHFGYFPSLDWLEQLLRKERQVDVLIESLVCSFFLSFWLLVTNFFTTGLSESFWHHFK